MAVGRHRQDTSAASRNVDLIASTDSRLSPRRRLRRIHESHHTAAQFGRRTADEAFAFVESFLPGSRHQTDVGMLAAAGTHVHDQRVQNHGADTEVTVFGQHHQVLDEEGDAAVTDQTSDTGGNTIDIRHDGTQAAVQRRLYVLAFISVEIRRGTHALVDVYGECIVPNRYLHLPNLRVERSSADVTFHQPTPVMLHRFISTVNTARRRIGRTHSQHQ